MKIAILNHADLRLEFVNVPDDMLDDDIDKFLAEHDFSLNNISWFAAPIDYLPVVFHEFGILHDDGSEVHFQRRARLKNLSIYDSVKEVKMREHEELAEALKTFGEKVDGGFECHFEGDCPIVAAYDYDDPCDMVILAARVDEHNFITLIGDEKDDRGFEHEVFPDDVFAGHLDEITTAVKRQSNNK